MEQQTNRKTEEMSSSVATEQKESGSLGKVIKLIIFVILLSPVFLVFIFLFLIIVIATIVTSSSDNGTSLSEYGESVIPTEYIPIYMEAGAEYEIDWLLLASIHRIETNFSTIEPMISPAGAIGHTQFMPCTWIGWSYPSCHGSALGNATIPDAILTSPSIIEQYGGYGVDGNNNGRADPFEIEDSIYTTAKYLKNNMTGEGEEAIRNAVFAYNRADWYVDEVLHYYSLFADGYTGEGVVAEIRGDKAWIVPFSKNISSSFGIRTHPITGEMRMHNGIDIAEGGIHGKPVVAFSDGEVIYSQFNSGGYGYLVIIQHDNNIKTYYAHLRNQGIPVGSNVVAGQVIGHVGSTGQSSGSHLHFEIRVNDSPVNPIPYLAEFFQ